MPDIFRTGKSGVLTLVGARALETLSLIHSSTHTHLPFVLNIAFLVSD